jgi:Undecaprenyl-phosphate glucose phosphotransferase
MSIEAASSPSAPASTARLSPDVVRGVVRFLDAALVMLGGLVIFQLYLGDEARAVLPYYLPVIVGGALMQVAAFESVRLYDVTALRRPVHRLGRMMLAWSGVITILLVMAFLTKTGEAFSRVWLIGWLAMGFVVLVAFRLVLARLVARWIRDGRLERRVVLVGGGERAENLIDAIEASKNTDIRVCGVFDDRGDRVPGTVRGYPKLGTVDALVDFARTHRVDMLIVTLPLMAEKRLLEMVKKLWVLPVDIRLSAHASAMRFSPRAYSYVGNVPLIDVVDKPIADWGHILKIIEDRVLAALFLLLGLPVFAVIAAAIKLDSKGPVFFKQKRYGFNNELIEVYKFRTLRTDMTDHNAERLVTADDPRVTRVGRFLRRTSLDELPQLITVLKGDMSIVGPRPHATRAKAGERLYQDVVDGYYARHRVKPGITGWAQINGWRGETDTEEKILRRTEHDLYYIENWSIWFDLYIIAMTPWALIRGDNAY